MCDAEGWGVGWGVLGAVGGHSMVCEAGVSSVMWHMMG